MPWYDAAFIDDVYERFIQEALRRSDAVMLVDTEGDPLSREAEAAEMRRFAELYKPFSAHDPDLYALLLARNAIISRDGENPSNPPAIGGFLARLEPCRLKIRQNAVAWPGTRLLADVNGTTKSRARVYVYRACDELLPMLREPGHIHGWMRPNYPEDLCFFKDHRCWFQTTTHEGYAFLHAENPEDTLVWQSFGLKPSTNAPSWMNTEERFYEEY